MKIMIVEDHEDFRDLMIRALARSSVEAIGFATIPPAKEFLESGQVVEAVVTDVTLQEPEDGLELVRWIKGHQSSVPVLVVTGSQDVGPRARAAGAVDVLVKPVTVSALTAALRRCK